MNEDWIIIGLLTTVGLGGAAVAVGAWLPKGKQLPDWFMAVGGTMALAAFCFAIILTFGWFSDRFYGDQLAIVLLSMIALGILLFSMGYVMDRWKRRRVGSHPMEMR